MAVSHDLSVVVSPADGEIRVTDTVTFDQPRSDVEFTLNAGLKPSVDGGEISRRIISDDGLRAVYRVSLQTPQRELKLHYHGEPVFSGRRGHGGMPQGIVAEQGVYLDGASAWYPRFGPDLRGIRLRVTLPTGWDSVSIGQRREADGATIWTSDQPHDDLYLLAGRFSRHAAQHGDITLSVYLLDDDPALAQRYLDVMGGYIDHYSGLIGDYPFAKFAVVENPWQTGYGMPSFTLLGARVMRLPFILYTSLPHEILHNWWGNGVWIDYAGGNWSEGLTAYLADHWMQARRGNGDQYRLKALQRYSNFAADGDDLPLTSFVSRHSDASQSIGYSKSLMLFHMLRSALGDDAFTAGLRRLWREHAFERVGFARTIDVISAEQPEIGRQMRAWLDRTGAPRIALDDVAVEQVSDGWRLVLSIRQTQGEPFAFDLPIAIGVGDAVPALRRIVRIDRAQQRVTLSLAERPLRVDIDPQYDVLRYLDPTEQPPALSRLFGSERTWLVMPDDADSEMRAAWHALAAAWTKRYPGLKLIDSARAEAIDPGDERIVLGWDNRALLAARPTLNQAGHALSADALQIGDTRYRRDTATVVVVGSDANGVTTGFIGAESADAVRQMARKLPHYSSYGRLVFDMAGQNLRKDTLSAPYSTLSRQLGVGSVELQLPRRPVLGGIPRG